MQNVKVTNQKTTCTQYNVQFYNRTNFYHIYSDRAANRHNLAEGTSEYTTCAGLLTTSSSTWPNSALFQIVASGVPASKLVIGKPANSGDATNGYIAPATLAGCISQAKSQGWSEWHESSGCRCAEV